MIKRKGIGPKLRFFIFMRDGFACQYCGGIAPHVKLQVDHKIPVSKGGTNEKTNLITSCFSCNIGKGTTVVGSAAPKEQREAAPKRTYTMIEPNPSAANEFKYNLNKLIARVHRHFGFQLSEAGENAIRYLLKKFKYDIVWYSIDEILMHLVHFRRKGALQRWDIEFYLSLIFRYCHMIAEKTEKYQRPYFIAVISRKFSGEYEPWDFDAKFDAMNWDGVPWELMILMATKSDSLSDFFSHFRPCYSEPEYYYN